MTSEEIKQKQPADLSTNSWLREIAYQLARSNEKGAEAIAELPRVKRAYTKRTP